RDQEWPRPGETEKQRDCEIANDVIELPTEFAARYPFGRPESSDHKQDHDGNATSFCAGTKTTFYLGVCGYGLQREVIVLVAARKQSGPLERCAGVQGQEAPPNHHSTRQMI